MDKREPILSDIKPSADDIALRQKQLQDRKLPPRMSALPDFNAAKPVSSKLSWMALVCAAIALALSAWLAMQWQATMKQLAAAQKVMVAQAENLKSLNDKLLATDESANLSLEGLKVLIKEHDSEIRKLWDLANKRLRAEIAATDKALAALKTSQASGDKDLRTALEKQQKTLETQHADMQKRMAALDRQMKTMPTEIELRLAQNAESIQSLETELAKLKKANPAADITKLRNELTELKSRLNQLSVNSAP